MKFRLYASPVGWNSRHSSIKTYLEIPVPSGITDEYATLKQVDNEENSDFGKYVFPVQTLGRWKCDDQFNASDLVDYDPDWFTPDIEE